MGGQWEQVEVDVEKWAGKDGGDGKTKKVWMTRPKDDFHYLSVNAVTMDVGEGGVDLTEWHEKGWVYYVQNRGEEKGKQQRDLPFPLGMY